MALAKGVGVIKTEKGETLTLKVNADTQFAINEPGVPNSRRASLADLKAVASVEVEYTSDGVPKSVIQNIRA